MLLLMGTVDEEGVGQLALWRLQSQEDLKVELGQWPRMLGWQHET